MFNVGFLSSGVTRACLNAVGKMPVRRDVLIMCVSAGRSAGEIAWRRCEGIGSRGHVVAWLERRSLDTIFVLFQLKVPPRLGGLQKKFINTVFMNVDN